MITLWQQLKYFGLTAKKAVFNIFDLVIINFFRIPDLHALSLMLAEYLLHKCRFANVIVFPAKSKLLLLQVQSFAAVMELWNMQVTQK